MQTLQWGKRMNLVNRPYIRQRLEQAEITMIDIGNLNKGLFHILCHCFWISQHLLDFHDQIQISPFRTRCDRKRNLITPEQGADFITIIFQIIPAFLHTLACQISLDFKHFKQIRMIIILSNNLYLTVKMCCFQHIKNQQR